MKHDNDHIRSFLQTSNQLQAFCSQNGWIINESIDYEILRHDRNRVMIYTTFLESIMEGSGCQCDQKSCYGLMQLILGEKGNVISSTIL